MAMRPLLPAARFGGMFSAPFTNARFGPPYWSARSTLLREQRIGDTLRRSFGVTGLADHDRDYQGLSDGYRLMVLEGHVPDAKAEALRQFLIAKGADSFTHTPDEADKKA